MTILVKKRVQYSVDQTILESAEKVGQDDFNTAKLIEVSHNLPSIKVSNDASIKNFFDNDGSY
jgi:hypothetical protein